jgi:Zn-dependent peptidase ImmA (M78 family)
VERGFKTDAERIATQIRRELRLGDRDALRPIELAKHLAVPVHTLTQAARHCAKPGALDFFRRIDPDCFSAITVFRGSRRIIVHNDSHHPHRQASNLAHELSHCLLGHEPEELVTEDGRRYWNAELV